MTFATTLPPVSNENIGADQFSCELLIDSDLHWFSGHFPADPIVPAVVQMGWVVHFGSKLGLFAAKISAIKRAKFTAVMRPDTRVVLQLVRREHLLEFNLASAEQVFASGVVAYVD